MKAVVLDAIPSGRAAGPSLAGLLDAELASLGYDEVLRFDVAATKLGFCQGEFDCWLRTPGRCKIQDREQAITAAIPAADALILLGPSVFGGFSSSLKLAVDRLICLIAPFFEERVSLTHHERRYERYPRLYAVGLVPSADEELRTTFEALNDANAINFFAPARGAALVEQARPELWPSVLHAALGQPCQPGAAISGREALREQLLAVARPESFPARGAPRTAALLVGSAKVKGTSASEQMACALARRLTDSGVVCDLHFATEFVHEGAPALAAARKIASADLFLLATPLYVDSLPALATRALELIAASRGQERGDALFVPLINCGFPEPEHTRTAIGITRHFARAAGYRFAGALPLGGGGVVTPDRALDAPARPPVAHIVQAIELAAAALAVGAALPEAALVEMVKPPVPDFLYRLMGELGFRWQAHERGTAQRRLRAAPFVGS